MSSSHRRDAPRAPHGLAEREPLWYRDAILYELRVGAFQDSDGDGVGDFRGLSQRLDYLAELGVTALWLLPFCPSPGRDDGYDISDYVNVHRDYGSLDDFKTFLREAHRRGLRVITELVINHTSDQHPWFQRARRAPPGSRWRDFYVWSDRPDRYDEARIIFRDFEPSNWTWDPVAKAYYWHRFYAHQPDLNFDSPDVRRAVFRFLDFWLRLGVDGVRLDAIPYLFEREGTSCENLAETHAFLKDLRNHVDGRFRDRMLLAEANQWPEDAVAYFGNGDECHMAFHFPVMPRLFMALHMEDRFPVIDILEQTPPIPDVCQWALFLRNHDELTLEMVTDEERDYMYGVYAADARARINLGIRRRLAPLLGSDRRRIELMNALLFSLPGTPVIYYGDEIGMGDNFYLGDRNGVRTPMQWSSDRNAGFSRANPQQLHLPVIVDPEYHYEAVNVEAQQRNPHSLLRWMQRLIALRRRHRAFGRGSIEFLHPSNRKVLAFVRTLGDERILVVGNLSRFVQYVELDLGAFRGQVAVELFSGRPFPEIGELPYLLTIGPHGFYWFRVEPPRRRAETATTPTTEPPRVEVSGGWTSLLEGAGREALEAALGRALPGRRWFAGKARSIDRVELVDALPAPAADAALLLARVGQEGGSATYFVPVAWAGGPDADAVRRDLPGSVLVEVDGPAGRPERSGVLFDALASEPFRAFLLDSVARRRRLRGEAGELAASATRRFRELRGAEDVGARSRLLNAEQSNSSIVYGDRLVLKVFRRLTEGENPDLELSRFLSERRRFPYTPALAGAFEYQAPKRGPATVGILQAFVQNEGDAWDYTLDQVQQFFERARARRAEPAPPPVPASPLADVERPADAQAIQVVGPYLEQARLLGQRSAELHLALAGDREDPAFAPEPFTTLYQRGLYQSLRNATGRSFQLLRESARALRDADAAAARALLGCESQLLAGCRAIVGARIGGQRIRCHGDYHLGQVLYTGNDFVVIDFEGEPSRSLGERRLKRSPLRDVAGMLRSFDYAAHHGLVGEARDAAMSAREVAWLQPWARAWQHWVGTAFLRGYLPAVLEAGLVPRDPAQLELLLRVLLIEKAVYELGYELDNRPAWVRIPIQSILRLLDDRR
jgi:maltose alpha-D-glucosyltransferase/alpha-amylase